MNVLIKRENMIINNNTSTYDLLWQRELLLKYKEQFSQHPPI